MAKPKIFHDFQNADSRGRLRLICAGTIDDLVQKKVELRDGLLLTFYSDDLDADGKPDELLTDGVVAFSAEEQCWVASIDWNAIRHASDSQANGDGAPKIHERKEFVA
jgi:hypothetical protein